MIGAMLGATGGFAFHPEIAIVLTITSAIVAVLPASRRAGLLAMLLWGVLASDGIGLKKYIGPLGFAAFGALTIAAAAAYSVLWAEFLVYPLACMEAFFVGSLAHQTAFEMATVGHLTSDFDSCATALMPLLFGFLLTIALITPGPLMLLFCVLRSAAQDETRPPHPLGTRSGRILITAGVAAGMAFGFFAWHDWQINQPCL
jgi:hypothetical protein